MVRTGSQDQSKSRGENMKKLVCIGGGEIPRYKDGILLPYETKE